MKLEGGTGSELVEAHGVKLTGPIGGEKSLDLGFPGLGQLSPACPGSQGGVDMAVPGSCL